MINLITILGPTASGKTRLAALLANRINGEVISADSRQVYKGMDLGTGKDYSDYEVDGKTVPYHLIDIADPGEEYNVFRYQQDFIRVYNDIIRRGRIPVMCGGTGLYIESVLGAYRMESVPQNEELRAELKQKSLEELAEKLRNIKPLHNITDITDRERALRAIEIAVFENERKNDTHSFPDMNSLIFGVAYNRSELRQRITQRLKNRMGEGMINEVKELLSSGVSAEKLDFYGLEYRYLARYVTGMITYDEMFSLLNTAIHQFAKRQATWFRRMERKGFTIHWLPGEWNMDEKMEYILQALEKQGVHKS
ncbi:MAG: tRNA (adenosine(37)-N6)-dimethylallyltransferase MiaA [Bacteroidales bacterium]